MHQDELQAIGQALREAREAQGLTLAEVEARTKIATPVLAALESGDTGRLPHPVYAKGFLRSYAALLGLDAAELGARFARAYPVPEEMDEAPEERAAHIRVTVRQPGDQPWRPWLVRLGLGLAVVVLAVGGWFGFRWYILPQLVALRQAASSVAQPAATPPSEAAPAPAPQPAAPPLAPPEPVEPPVNATPAAPPPVETPPAPATEAPSVRVMRVEALANCWLQAKADDKVTDYFLRQGERVEIRFASSLRLKLGNAAGVRLTLDGRPFPVEATRPGEVRTITVP